LSDDFPDLPDLLDSLYVNYGVRVMLFQSEYKHSGWSLRVMMEERIRQAARTRYATPIAMAEALGCSRVTAWRFRTGRRHLPSATLIRLLEELEVDI
jgi:hypothetical protein